MYNRQMVPISSASNFFPRTLRILRAQYARPLQIFIQDVTLCFRTNERPLMGFSFPITVSLDSAGVGILVSFHFPSAGLHCTSTSRSAFPQILHAQGRSAVRPVWAPVVGGLLVRCHLPESRIEKQEGFSQRPAPRLGPVLTGAAERDRSG